MKDLKVIQVIRLLFIMVVVGLSSPSIFNAYIVIEDVINPIDTRAIVEFEQVELNDAEVKQLDLDKNVEEQVEESVELDTYELEPMPVLLDLKLEEIPIVSDFELWEMPSIKAVTFKTVTLDSMQIKDAGTIYKYIHWDEAQNVLTRGMEYKVTDVLTGESWNMIRLGGVNHADSVSRTPEDTETMLRVFGEWTWEPRAVIIDTVSGYRMPAALRGMPHDIWANWNGNEMLGHVCLYFFGSRTHFSNVELESAQQQIKVAEDFLMQEQMNIY